MYKILSIVSIVTGAKKRKEHMNEKDLKPTMMTVGFFKYLEGQCTGAG